MTNAALLDKGSKKLKNKLSFKTSKIKFKRKDWIGKAFQRGDVKCIRFSQKVQYKELNMMSRWSVESHGRYRKREGFSENFIRNTFSTQTN